MTGEEFQERRLELGWTQALLADRLGVTRSIITHWEQERAPIPRDVERTVLRASRTMEKLVSQMDRMMWG